MTEAPARQYRVTVDGAQVKATVTELGLDLDGQLTSWLDIDDLGEGDHRLQFDLADGRSIVLGGLGTTHDDFVAAVRVARRRQRLPALTVATTDPLVSYASRAAGGYDVHLFAKVLVIEPRRGTPAALPLSLIEQVHRDGFTVSITARGLPAAEVKALGAQTDEFVMRLANARRELQAAVCTAYASFEPRLEGYVAPDGWAQDKAGAGGYWGVLDEAVRSGERGEYVAQLAALAGDRMAIGLYTDGGTATLPFVLAAVGNRVAVESADDEARATYVFDAPDIARLNAVLVLTSFRREAIFLPDDQMGRWAVAARTWPIIKEARAALTARIVHDDSWASKVRAAFS